MINTIYIYIIIIYKSIISQLSGGYVMLYMYKATQYILSARLLDVREDHTTHVLCVTEAS